MLLKDRLRELYEGDSREAHNFRYGLLIFDATTIVFIVITSFLPRSSAFEWMDVFIGLTVLLYLVGREVMMAGRRRATKE